GSIKLITSRGESGAVNMADGYARATSKMGVVITSTGTGAGNAAGSLAETWNAGFPILHITGEIESDYIKVRRQYIHEIKDQQKIMEGASKDSYLIRKPERIVSTLRKAIHHAFTPPFGPITVEIPIDYQSAIVPKTDIIETKSGNLESTEEPFINLPNEIIDKIKASRRPVLWAGGGVIKSNASKQLKRLAELIGAPVITSQAGKGSIPEKHPLCIGYFSSHSNVSEFLEESDLLISVGTQFRSRETIGWKLSLPKDHISINNDSSVFNVNYLITHGIVGDAKKVLLTIINNVSNSKMVQKQNYLSEAKKLREDVRQNVRDNLGPYRKIADSIISHLPEDAIFVRDETIPANVWGSRIIETNVPRTSIYSTGGGIGQGLPLAIGAQVGCMNQTVVLMVGDGGFLVNAGEMATAAQENLPIIIILFDDSSYGILKEIQKVTFGTATSVDLKSPDFVKMGQAMGYISCRVITPGDFESKFQHAIFENVPTLIVVDS